MTHPATELEAPVLFWVADEYMKKLKMIAPKVPSCASCEMALTPLYECTSLKYTVQWPAL